MKMRFAAICGVLLAAGTLAALELENERLSIHFADPAAKAGVLGITDVRHNAEFFRSADAAPILWRIELSEPGSDLPTLALDNRQAATVKIVVQSKERLTLEWSGYSANGIAGILTVKLTVTLQPDGQSVWTLTPELRTQKYALQSLVFPYFAKALEPAQEKLLFPRGNAGSRITTEPMSGKYPSWESQVQFLGIFGHGGGLYCGTHDARAVKKQFEYTAENALMVRTFAEDMSVAGKARIPAYPVVIAPAATPWAACALYREWAKTAPWTVHGTHAAQRAADPQAIDGGKTELWLYLSCHGAIPAGTDQALKELQKLPGVQMAAHWYGWNAHKHDHHYPEFFPCGDGAAAAAEKMRQAGLCFFPYINGRLWDTTIESYASALPEVCTNVKGEPIIEVYGASPKLAAMCVSSPQLTAKVGEAVDRLVAELHPAGIYVDQVASVEPTMCFNPRHGHPLGGGSWWVDGYRRMLTPIRDKYAGKLLFYSENGADPYMDLIDVFLLWGFLYTNDFPSLPAVYNQYAYYLCQLALAEDDHCAFAAALSRCLLWNIQPGWMYWLHGAWKDGGADPQFDRDYTERVIRMRRLAKPVIADGVPLGDVQFTPEPETVKITFYWTTYDPKTVPPTTGDAPAVYGVWWQSANGGKALAAIANVTEKEYRISVKTDAEFLNFAKGRTVVRIAADGTRTAIGKAGAALPLTIAPLELLLLETE